MAQTSEESSSVVTESHSCVIGNYLCTSSVSGEFSWSRTTANEKAVGSNNYVPSQSQSGASSRGIIGFLYNFLYFLNNTVVPFIIALAFLFFIWNAFRFFIYEGASEEGRTKARRLMLYGIGAFVLILSVWAIVNILVSTFGFQSDRALTSDYIKGGASGGTPSASYSCTTLAFGFEWCGESSGWIPRHTPGSGPEIINPNPPSQTNTFSFP